MNTRAAYKFFHLLFCLLPIVAALVRPQLVMAQDKPAIGVSLPLSGGSASEGIDLRNMLSFANRHVAGNAYKLEFDFFTFIIIDLID